MIKLTNFKLQIINKDNDPNGWFKGYTLSPWGPLSKLNEIIKSKRVIYYAKADYKEKRIYIYDLIAQRVIDEKGVSFVHNYFYNKLMDLAKRKNDQFIKEKKC